LGLKCFPRDLTGMFLDIGANRGQSIESIMLVRPKAKIVAFEPNPELWNKLRKRYGHQREIQLCNIALSDQEDEIDLFVPSYHGYSFDGLASLDYEKAFTWLSSRTLFFFSEQDITVQRYEIQSKTLDSLKLQPFFIKIDVQGFELNVIKGALETIKQHSPVFLIESLGKKSEIMSILNGFGYRMYAFRDGYFFEDEQGALNSFAMNDSKAQLLGQNQIGRAKNHARNI